MRLLCSRRATGNRAYIWFFFWNFWNFTSSGFNSFWIFQETFFGNFRTIYPPCFWLDWKFSRLLVSFCDRPSVDRRGKRWTVGHNCLFLCAKSKKSNSIQEPEQVRENCERSQTFQCFFSSWQTAGSQVFSRISLLWGDVGNYKRLERDMGV